MEQRETALEVDEVNIEEIMQKIRAQILAKKAKTAGNDMPIVQVQGRRLPAEFYEHLYEAGLTYDQTQTQVYLSHSRVPIVGPLLQWVRRKVHELVVFYVNQVAANQIRVNTHLLQAISILSEELERAEHND